MQGIMSYLLEKKKPKLLSDTLGKAAGNQALPT